MTVNEEALELHTAYKKPYVLVVNIHQVLACIDLSFYPRMTNFVCLGSELEYPKTWSMHSESSNWTAATADSDGETSFMHSISQSIPPFTVGLMLDENLSTHSHVVARLCSWTYIKP